MTPAALARNTSARAARSVFVAVVVFDPALRLVGILVPPLGRQVEEVIGAVQSLDAAGVARVGVEDGAPGVLVEHAEALAVRDPGVAVRVVVEHRAALDFIRRERHVVVVVEVGVPGRHPLEAPSHAPLERLDLGERGARDGDERHIAVVQVHAGGIVVIGPERAVPAALVPLWGEHEVIDDQLAAAGEQVGQRLLPVHAVERVGLFDALPRQRLPLPIQLVLGAGERLLAGEQRGTRGEPLVVRDDGMVAELVGCHGPASGGWSGAGCPGLIIFYHSVEYTPWPRRLLPGSTTSMARSRTPRGAPS